MSQKTDHQSAQVIPNFWVEDVETLHVPRSTISGRLLRSHEDVDAAARDIDHRGRCDADVRIDERTPDVGGTRAA